MNKNISRKLYNLFIRNIPFPFPSNINFNISILSFSPKKKNNPFSVIHSPLYFYSLFRLFHFFYLQQNLLLKLKNNFSNKPTEYKRSILKLLLTIRFETCCYSWLPSLWTLACWSLRCTRVFMLDEVVIQRRLGLLAIHVREP